MKEIEEKDVEILQKKVSELSVALAIGKIKNVKQLTEIVKIEFPSAEDRIFCLSILIADRYIKLANEFVNGMKKKSEHDLMFC